MTLCFNFASLNNAVKPEDILGMIRPKLLDTLKGYNRQQFVADMISGVIVGIVALPLAIAFGIASGVSPEKGLFTAIIAGFIISALGGSKVQIGGPTGAFIVIVYGIVQQYGINGLVVATFMAGILLIAMGLLKFGSLIKFIPHPLIVGFTTGIAVIIFSSQIKDSLGLSMGSVPADFLHKCIAFSAHIHTINPYAVVLMAATVAITQSWSRISKKIPGSLVAIILTTALVYLFPNFGGLAVETIGSKFGAIQATFPTPSWPCIDLTTIQLLIRPAFTIALLGGIESLLSAVVADGMTGGRHRSNTELVAQGVANIVSAAFGGIPATGAIARTATNIKNGGRTPIAGMVHAITLLIIVLFVGKLAAFIPMATLSGILIVVSYNMSEWRNFVGIAKSRSGDSLVLLITFVLTVLVDLTVAIEIGMIAAMLLFMTKMTRYSNVTEVSGRADDSEADHDTDALSNYTYSKAITVFEINGPLFFGAAYKFKEAVIHIEQKPKVLVIRMRNVPIIDGTGLRTLAEVETECSSQHIKLILTEVNTQSVYEELSKYRLVFRIGKANIVSTIAEGLDRAAAILDEK